MSAISSKSSYADPKGRNPLHMSSEVAFILLTERPQMSPGCRSGGARSGGFRVASPH